MATPRMYDVSAYTGAQLGQLLCDLVSQPNYGGPIYQFTSGDQNIFTLQPQPTQNQPANGRICFGSVCPSWDSFNLGPRFAEQYAHMRRAQIQNIQNEYFQPFVLMQFEMARRVPAENPANFFSQNQIANGINAALQLNTAQGYQQMIGMFNGTYQSRLGYYQQLIPPNR